MVVKRLAAETDQRFEIVDAERSLRDEGGCKSPE
jgi:hypothetical protein